MATTTIAFTLGGAVRKADEGAAAHLFQLFMAASLLTSLTFVVLKLGRSPWQTLRVLAIQFLAALSAVAPVFYFKL